MKTTINGKRYNSEKCETLAKLDHYSYGSNNYSGSSALMRAPDGTLLIQTDGNGQDCWTIDNFRHISDLYNSPSEFISLCDLDDDEEARLVELGLIEIIG